MLTAIIPDGSTETQSYWVNQKGKAEAWLTRHNGNRNLYFLVNNTFNPMGKKPKKSDIAGCVAFHVDCDPVGDQDISDERRRILTQIETFDLRPSFIIDSGGGYQAFWNLAAPLHAQDYLVEIEAINRGLANALGGDNCHNIDRIMRLPGTINIPNKRKRDAGRVPTPATLVWYEDSKYIITEFQRFELFESQKLPVFEINPLPINLPEVDLLLLPIPQKWKMIAVHGHDPGEQQQKPSRSEWVFGFMCVCIRAQIPDEIIASMLLDPDLRISDHVRDQAHPRRYAARQIATAKGKVNG